MAANVNSLMVLVNFDLTLIKICTKQDNVMLSSRTVYACMEIDAIFYIVAKLWENSKK